MLRVEEGVAQGSAVEGDTEVLMTEEVERVELVASSQALSKKSSGVLTSTALLSCNTETREALSSPPEGCCSFVYRHGIAGMIGSLIYNYISTVEELFSQEGSPSSNTLE
jgi:hypothetical protein